MKPSAFRHYASLTILLLLVACGDQGASQAATADTTSVSVTRTVAVQQNSPAPRLRDLPRQIRDYHQTTYVDECRAYENSTLTVREPGYVTTADFNGDGRPDYVLSGTHLDCSAGATYICGNGTCPFDMFLSQGDGFTMVNAVGHEGELTRQGESPAFMVTAKSGQVNRLGPATAGGSRAGSSAAAPTTAGFTVNVAMSPQAASAFAANRDVLVLSASWQGPPLPAREREADEMGEIDLGWEEVRLPPQGGRATFTGSSFKTERTAWVLPGKANINVNIMSATGEGYDSAISCTPAVSGPFTQIAGRTHNVRCNLITEGQAQTP